MSTSLFSRFDFWCPLPVGTPFRGVYSILAVVLTILHNVRARHRDKNDDCFRGTSHSGANLADPCSHVHQAEGAVTYTTASRLSNLQDVEIVTLPTHVAHAELFARYWHHLDTSLAIA